MEWSPLATNLTLHAHAVYSIDQMSDFDYPLIPLSQGPLGLAVEAIRSAIYDINPNLVWHQPFHLEEWIIINRIM